MSGADQPAHHGPEAGPPRQALQTLPHAPPQFTGRRKEGNCRNQYLGISFKWDLKALCGQLDR